jgi:hypothetical protein
VRTEEGFMNVWSRRFAACFVALAPLVVALPRGADAQGAMDCAMPPSADPLEAAARRELGKCTGIKRNPHGEVTSVWIIDPTADEKKLVAFIARHPRDFGLTSVAELARAKDGDLPSSYMVQRVPGVPKATVRCETDDLLPDRDAPSHAVELSMGMGVICLLPDLASAAARPRIGEAAAKGIAVTEARDSGDEAPRASAVKIVARRRHPLFERRGVLVYRVTVLEQLGVRYVDVEADTGQVLDTKWTSTLPASAEETGDIR